MSRRRLDAIVIGAGLVGSAAALGLARAGLRVAIVEARAPAPWQADAPPDLRVFAISPASSDLLAELGVWPAIAAARVAPYRHMRVWDAAAPDDGVAFHGQDIGASCLGHIVEQSLIQSELWRAIVADTRIVRHCPARVVGVEQGEQGEHGIGVELEDGTHVHASLLVCADGAASPMRERLGIATRGRDYGAQGVVGFIRTERPHENTAWQRFLPSGPLAVLPFSEGHSSIVWSLPDDEARRVLALDDAAFARELEHFRSGGVCRRTHRAPFRVRIRCVPSHGRQRRVVEIRRALQWVPKRRRPSPEVGVHPRAEARRRASPG